MKKPLNKFSLALWIIVIAYIGGEVWWFWTGIQFAKQFAGNTYYVPDTAWKIVQSLVTVGGLLGSLGVLIELVDRIRWHIVRKPQ